MFQKITDGSLPAQEGWYTTNFGNSYFNGTTFLMPGMNRPTPTTVEFWMKEVEAEKVTNGDDKSMWDEFLMK